MASWGTHLVMPPGLLPEFPLATLVPAMEDLIQQLP